MTAPERKCLTLTRHDRSVGECAKRRSRQRLSRMAGSQSFAMENCIDCASLHRLPVADCRCEVSGKILCSLSLALEAGSVPGGKCGDLVEKEQLGIGTRSHDPTMALLEGAEANDPCSGGPPPLEKRARDRIVDDAAIAHRSAARRPGMNRPERVDAVLKRHRIQTRGASIVAKPAMTRADPPARVIRRRTLGRWMARRAPLASRA